VQGHYGKLFEGDPTGTVKLPDVNYGAGPEDPRLLDIWPRSASRSRSRWPDRAAMDGGRLSRAAQRGDQDAFVEFMPGLIDGLAHAEDPDDAVTAFDRFLGACSAAAG
jgi:glutamate-ammonia-ligase adenylyltransferase